MTRLSCAFLFLLVAISAAFCQTTIVWQMGKYDQSSMEFMATPRDHVVYQAGSNSWARDWPGEQRTGSAYEIQFDLKNPPRGIFQLKIGILANLHKIPALQVQINGHKGTFYLNPEVSYATLDPHPLPSAVLMIELPEKYLRAGQNSLILSCLDTHPGSDGASGLRYDALSLTNNLNGAHTGSEIHAEITPTIFYRQTAGQLVEVVDATLRSGQPIPAGLAILSVRGQRYETTVTAMQDFGEERLEFEIPEWTGTTPARLEIIAARRSTFNVSLTAARKWTLWVVPHTHVDIGYTDYQGKVAEIQARTLEEAAGLIQKHPDFRFATDGSWNLEQFLATRSKEKREEILNLIRDDKIGVPAQYVNLLTGYASLETLYRSLYYSKRLSRQSGLPFVYANTTDVPTYTGAYPSVLASAGIKYWAVGGNNDRAPVLAHEQWNKKSPFWWEGPDGKKVLFWYSRGYAQISSVFGLPPQPAAGYDSLPIFLQAYSQASYKPDFVLLYGAQDENTDLHPEIADFANSWNQKYSYPKLQYATFADFFRYLDEHDGNDLPTYRGDMGPYWEDGVGADAYYTAEDRRNQNQALSADILSTLSHSLNPDVHAPRTELDDAWTNMMLFAEHTWTAGNSVSQPDSEESVKQLAVKDNRATQASFEIEDVANRALGQLADQIHVPARTLVVFNALSWKRDAFVETDLRGNEELVDLTSGKPVAVEVLFRKQGFAHVRFLATDLPAVGYKCFQIRFAAASTAPEQQVEKGPVIENQYYRITVDAGSGAVQSIFDKQLQRELVDNHGPYKFGQYLYVTGGDGQTRMIRPIQALPAPQLTVHPAGDGEYLGKRKTPWGHSIQLRSSDLNTPEVHLEILLYDSQKKIEFRYSVRKQYTTAKEGVYFAFPIAVSSPKFAYEIQQGWIDPARDLLKGASLEWFTVQHWMAADDPHLAVGIVPLDAPLASFGDINRGEWPGEFHPRSSTIFSYAMNNYWHTNYPAGQGGAFQFRYVVTSADHFDPAALTRIGWESMEPVELDHGVGQDKIGDPERPLPATGASFLQIDAPNVLLADWKLADDDHGTVLRLQETAGQATETTLQLPRISIRSAHLCSSVEDNVRPLDVKEHELRLNFKPYEVLTVRLELNFHALKPMRSPWRH